MGILAVGSVALDSVKTPFGQEEEVLGGSATFFSIAASYFTDVSLVAVVGEDFLSATSSSCRSWGSTPPGWRQGPEGRFAGKANTAPI